MSDERCNADLGPLTAKLLEQQREIARLTFERDEARRLYCITYESYVAMGLRLNAVPCVVSRDVAERHAKVKGWDCFKEDSK